MHSRAAGGMKFSSRIITRQAIIARRRLASSEAKSSPHTAALPSVASSPSAMSPPPNASSIARGIGRMTELVFERGEGSWVWTASGDKFLDMTCGIGVTNTGHCHPKVVAAAQEQCGKLVHGQINIAYHSRMLELCDSLRANNVMPHPSLDTFFFWNSGAEAVEAAIKLARHATGRPGVLVFKGGYHGRTIGTMSLTTSKNIYSAGFGPLMPGVFVAPFPYTNQWRRWLAHSSDASSSSSPPLPLWQLPAEERAVLDERCVAHALHEARLVLKQQAAATDIGAVLIEPVQGEGGYVPPPSGFMAGLRELCDETGMLLVADEVQSGFGRTGSFFAVEQIDGGVAPDILIFAKGVASGFPLSGIAAPRELMERQPPGSQGGTYAGNAVSCAAALATVEVMLEENMLGNAAARGDQLQSGLRRIVEGMGEQLVSDIRGMGLMVGLEFFGGADGGHDGVAALVSKRCLEKGMLVLTTSVFETLRFIPALNVTEAELDLALAIFEEALHEVASELPTRK